MKDQKKLIKNIIKRSNFEIELYHKNNLKDKYRCFIGSPQKDPHDKTKIILLIDPFTDNEKYLEFPVKSIGHIEEIGTISSNEGKTALQVKIWIKKSTIAFETKTFIV